MTQTYKLVAVPFLRREGEFKGHLEKVTFIAASETETHKWCSVNDGTYEAGFSTFVSHELSTHIVERLRAGETVEFPNRYELEQVKGEIRTGGEAKKFDCGTNDDRVK